MAFLYHDECGHIDVTGSDNIEMEGREPEKNPGRVQAACTQQGAVVGLSHFVIEKGS